MKIPIHLLKRIKYLQKKFNLGDAYILDYIQGDGYLGVLFPKAIQNSQLSKIQKSKPLIRTSKKRNGKLIIAPEPFLLKVIKSEANMDKFPISLTHLSWLREKFNIKERYDIEIGKPYKESIGGFNF